MFRNGLLYNQKAFKDLEIQSLVELHKALNYNSITSSCLRMVYYAIRKPSKTSKSVESHLNDINMSKNGI